MGTDSTLKRKSAESSRRMKRLFALASCFCVATIICYNIAHQDTWSQIFNINTENDIIDRILSIYQKDKYYGENANVHYKPYWITDQLYLYEKTQEWNIKTNNS